MEGTINYKGVEFDVEFDYQPFEKAETGPYAQYPGCPESIGAIYEIKHKGTCFLEFFESDGDMEAIENEIWEVLHEIN